jgi:hypothetical protein
LQRKDKDLKEIKEAKLKTGFLAIDRKSGQKKVLKLFIPKLFGIVLMVV